MEKQTEKWTLITGASSGIGAATARMLAKQGHNLILTGRRAERLQTVQAELKTPGLQIILACFDIRKPEQIIQFVQKHSEHLKKVDVLINNAGLAKGVETVQEGHLQDWDTMLDTNVRGLLHFTRALLPFLLERPSAHIVNMGSVAGRWVYPGGAVYCATKFAVRAFTEGLRQDLLGKNIRVSNIEPGMVNTEFSAIRYSSQAKADAVYAGMQPLTAEDIADTIGWILSRPGHVNIQEVVVYPTAQAHIGMVHRS